MIASGSTIAGACAPPESVANDPEVVGASQESLGVRPRPFDVEFTTCEDTAGITPIARAAADALVPDAFVLTGASPSAAFIVRLASCRGVSVEGSPSRPATVVQVGASILAPDGNTANINNYTGWYYTDHPLLALRLRLIGVNAEWVPALAYSYTKNAAGTGGSLLVRVPGHPALTIQGEVSEPVASPVVYVSHWWRQGPRGIVDMTTTLPAISFGSAPVLTITTPSNSEIARLLGAPSTTFATFHSFSRSTPELLHVAVEAPTP